MYPKQITDRELELYLFYFKKIMLKAEREGKPLWII